MPQMPSPMAPVPTLSIAPMRSGALLRARLDSAGVESRSNAEFPCNNPINPHMRNFEARLATFALGWPSSRVRASPDVLAQTGLFFLGERDKAKCWYCNGGLQNWEYEDDPWLNTPNGFPSANSCCN